MERTIPAPGATGRGTSRRASRRRAGLLLVPALLALTAAGCSGSPEHRIERIRELEQLPADKAEAKVRRYLEDPDGNVRATAYFYLLGVPIADAEVLALKGLKDPDAFVRATVAKCSGDLKLTSAVPQLANLLREDAHPYVRQKAAEALAEIGGEEAGRALVAGLGDPMKRVRLAAVKGVARVGSRRAVPELSNLLLSDPEWEIRAQAARALGHSGNADAAAPLQAALDDPNEYVRAAAVNALDDLQSAEVKRGGA